MPGLEIRIAPGRDELRLEAYAKLATGGYRDVSAAAVWSSSAPEIAAFDARPGVLRGGADGRATITASHEGEVATWQLEAVDGVLAWMTELCVGTGGALALRAPTSIGLSGDGDARWWTSHRATQHFEIAETSSPATVVHIGGVCYVTPLELGTVVVRGRRGGQVFEVAREVREAEVVLCEPKLTSWSLFPQPPFTMELGTSCETTIDILVDGQGADVDRSLIVAWSCEPPEVLRFETLATGFIRVHAHAEGTAQLRATFLDHSRTTTVVVYVPEPVNY